MNAIVDFPVATSHNSLEHLVLEYDQQLESVFSWMTPKPRPCFTSKLLEEVQQFERLLEANQGHFNVDGRPQRVRFLVSGSKCPGVYSLGGDLEIFVQAIMRRDAARLNWYADLCAENIYRRFTGFAADIPTFTLVQGKCFGGGFECALTSDVLVAERDATFSFPELLFNLIPGMGAISLLARRVGHRKAEEIIMSGKIYTAKEMQELGVVDCLTENGLGLATVRELISQRRRKLPAHTAMFRAKLLSQPLSKQELFDIAHAWVECALRLETRDLRMMTRLIRSQNKMMSCGGKSDAEDLYEQQSAAVVGAD